MKRWIGLIGGVLVLVIVAVLWAQNVDDVMKAALDAAAQGKTEEALKLTTKALELDPKNPRVHFVRGTLHESLHKHQEAIADYNKALELDPKMAEGYDRRGSEKFKVGDVAGSVADFDKYVELKPQEYAGHWKRGISCYYAGKFSEGAKQFTAYEKVDTNDVENAVWHFLCVARGSNVAKARESLLKIGKDGRVPMMQVYDLFAGKIQSDDVMTAVKQGNPGAKELNQRLFYAELYLGLYREVEGDQKKALEHLNRATDDYKIGHYMWDVARVHRDLLKAELKNK